MKLQITDVIVVEGKNDIAFLSSFIDADFVLTHGYYVHDRIIELLKNIQNRNIILLLDPDGPGTKIRDILKQHLPNAINCVIVKSQAIKHNSVGIENSSKDVIIDALKDLITYGIPKQSIDYATYLDLNLDANKRRKIADKLYIPYANNKTFFKYLNMLALTSDKIVKLLSEPIK
jgi:ribonuclease M5